MQVENKRCYLIRLVSMKCDRIIMLEVTYLTFENGFTCMNWENIFGT